MASSRAYALGDAVDTGDKYLVVDGSGDASAAKLLAKPWARIFIKATDTAAGKAALGVVEGFASGGLAPPHKLTDQTAKTGNYTLTAADSGTRIPCNGTSIIITVPAAATLGNGFGCEVVNINASAATTDGPGATNLSLAQYEAAYIFVTGGVLLAAKATYTAL